jgi:hypothetical protein
LIAAAPVCECACVSKFGYLFQKIAPFSAEAPVCGVRTCGDVWIFIYLSGVVLFTLQGLCVGVCGCELVWVFVMKIAPFRAAAPVCWCACVSEQLRVFASQKCACVFMLTMQRVCSALVCMCEGVRVCSFERMVPQFILIQSFLSILVYLITSLLQMVK